MRIPTIYRAATIAIGSALFAIHALAQNPPASGPVESERFPRQLPPQPQPQLDPLYSPDPLGFMMNPWNDWKAKLDQNYGLKVEGSYTLHDQYANHTISDRNNEFGGRFDLAANWTALHYNQKDVGQIIFLMRSSHNIGMSQEYALSDDVGSIMGTNSLHGGGEQIPISVNLLYWRHHGRAYALAGQTDVGYLWGIANDVAWQLDAI